MTEKSKGLRLYDHPSDMEQLLPEERHRGGRHPTTRKIVAELVRSMNSYYSNLIEGHRTKPRDIDAAIRKDFSRNPTQRCLQIQHLSHMEIQHEMEKRQIGR